MTAPKTPPVWTDEGLPLPFVEDVLAESERQADLWGVQSHTPAEWSLILAEEWGELGQELCRAHFDGVVPANLEVEAIQVATLALKIAHMARRAREAASTSEEQPDTGVRALKSSHTE